jgi:sugar/nucleoside kinase (ribokinase family)
LQLSSPKSTVLAPETLGPTITIGEILVEIMATTVGDGFIEAQPLIGPYPSGAPAIFIDQVARMGGASAIIASVGNDDFGRLNVERLRMDGVDVSAITVVDEWPTGSAFVRYRPEGARDFVFNIAKSAAGRIGLTPSAKALIARAGHVHVMGTALTIPGARDVVLHAIQTVRTRGGSVSLDPNLRKELMTDSGTLDCFNIVLDAADLLLPSGEELFTAVGVTDEAEAIARLHEKGIGEIVVKRGEHGASFFGRDQGRIDCAAFVVEEIDPTGAGDCFGAAFLTCRRKGMDPDAALLHASAAGARNVTRRGPMEGVSSSAELTAFIAETPRR